MNVSRKVQNILNKKIIFIVKIFSLHAWITKGNQNNNKEVVLLVFRQLSNAFKCLPNIKEMTKIMDQKETKGQFSVCRR